MRRPKSAFHSPTRDQLISAALDFCQSVAALPGVERVAFIGSICTEKREPKDVDLLLTISPEVDMDQLAKLGRQLKGKTQRINRGADVFLSNSGGEYIGRTCHWRECRPGIRMACEALNCGRMQYLYDDLQNIEIGRYQIANPPLIVHPNVVVNTPIASDLMNEIRMRFE